MEPVKGNTLSKAERLSSKKDISRLIGNGRWGVCDCVKYCYLSPNGLDFNRIMVSVPKKHFKRAVKRNLLKRRLREAYRTQKSLCREGDGVDIMFQYDSTELMPFSCIQETVAKILKNVK
ncbi:MAG: ribonuclease P protein component [Bacteroidales bacterium]|jgi:ribonuclease P protein component|nr:ribonuclease P protein component [Bacteroidales bacterium]MBQ1906429.1 ribonuclease P protein component [Bacteroidales bacterium]MBQ2104835.1 ribonuclease P protein component [Bacteroidales bacterium]MBQ3976684.1 ribonuclease P protein component [Bacteroidales bacterium]MBQ4168237.1 ribonuclease P protein component [Bacteroidales bacterium]